MKPKYFHTKHSFLSKPLLIALALSPVFCAPTALAQTWSGLGSDANWMTPGNWDVLPQANSVLTFAGTTQLTNTNNFPVGTVFNGLVFAPGAGAFTATPITSNGVRMEGNIANQSSSDQDFSAINFFMHSGDRIIDTGAQTLTLGDIWSTGPTVRTHTKIGSGTLRLTADGSDPTSGSGANSGDYTRFNVDEGTLLIDANSAQNRQTVESVTINALGTVKLGSGSTTPGTDFTGFLYGFVSMNGGTFDLNDHTLRDSRFATLNGTGLITNTGSGFASMSIASRTSTTETFAGVIEDGTGSVGVEILYGGSNGGRVNVFTGTNTYTGDTQIDDQTLVINGDQSAATGTVTVQNKAGARLGGFGTIGGAVSVGGQFSPGDITAANTELPGMITILGELTFDPAATFTRFSTGVPNALANRSPDFNVNVTDWGAGITAGTDYDTVIADSINLMTTNANKLSINLSFTGAAVTNFDDTAQSFTLATTTSGVYGLESGVGVDNWQVNVTGVAASGIWDLSVVSNELILTYTPAEPSADVIWDGGGADDKFSSALNWEGDVAPVAPQSIGFAGSSRLTPENDLGGETSLGVATDIYANFFIAIVPSVDGIQIGQTVSGTGITPGTTVVSIDSPTQITLSQVATIDQAAAPLTYTSVASPPQMNGITFLSGASPFNVSGLPLALGSAVETPVRITNDSASLQTLALGINIASNSNELWSRSGNLEITGKMSATSAKKVTAIGPNTTTLSGTEDNAYLNVDALEGTLVLAKTSSPTIHAAFNVVLGEGSFGTVQLGGTGGDQIAANIGINGGVFDLNGINETINDITSSSMSTGVITNSLAASTATLTVSGSGGNDYQTIADGAGVLAVNYQSSGNAQTIILGNNSYSGGTTVNGSYLRIEKSTPLGSGPVTFVGLAAAKSTVFAPSNGAFTGAPGLANDLIVNAPNRGKIRWGRSQTVSGSLTGDGTLVVTHENRNGQGTNVTGDWSAFAGTVIFKPGDAGSVTTNTTNLTLSNPTGLPDAALSMVAEIAGVPDGNAGSNGDLRYGGPANVTVPIGDLSSSNTTGFAALAMYNNTAGTTTFEVGGLGLSSSFGAQIRDGGGVTAITKTGAGTWTLLDATNSYTGQTAVDEGTLVVAHNLADGAPVKVAFEAVLDLAVANDVVDSLWLNGVQVSPGTYGPVGSAATHDSDHFTGSGYLNVTNGPVGGYASWAMTNVGSESPSEDFDNDGVQNGVEYFMNSAAGFTASPGLVGGSVTWPNGGNIPEGAYGTQYQVQTSPDLGFWSNVLVGDPNLNNIEGSVSYTPATGQGKIFVRLMVTPN